LWFRSTAIVKEDIIMANVIKLHALCEQASKSNGRAVVADAAVQFPPGIYRLEWTENMAGFEVQKTVRFHVNEEGIRTVII
jgi:hypothetical protein